MVDLPHPLCPTSATDLPLGTVNDRSCRTWTPGALGYAKLMFLTARLPLSLAGLAPFSDRPSILLTWSITW